LHDGGSDVVDAVVGTLRIKLGPVDANGTVRAVGYRSTNDGLTVTAAPDPPIGRP
jgi:DNA-binding response OmpR family regulator